MAVHSLFIRIYRVFAIKFSVVDGKIDFSLLMLNAYEKSNF